MPAPTSQPLRFGHLGFWRWEKTVGVLVGSEDSKQGPRQNRGFGVSRALEGGWVGWMGGF